MVSLKEGFREARWWQKKIARHTRRCWCDYLADGGSNPPVSTNILGFMDRAGFESLNESHWVVWRAGAYWWESISTFYGMLAEWLGCGGKSPYDFKAPTSGSPYCGVYIVDERKKSYRSSNLLHSINFQFSADRLRWVWVGTTESTERIGRFGNGKSFKLRTGCFRRSGGITNTETASTDVVG